MKKTKEEFNLRIVSPPPPLRGGGGGEAICKMWTEGLEKQVVDDLVAETPAQQESLGDKVDALRTWWREESVCFAWKKSETFDPGTTNEILRKKLYIGSEYSAYKIAETHPQIKAVITALNTIM